GDAPVVGDGATAGRFDLVDDLLRRRGVGTGSLARPTDVVHDHRRAFGCEQQRLRAPDPATGTGHDRHLVVEQTHAVPPEQRVGCVAVRRSFLTSVSGRLPYTAWLTRRPSR